MATRRKLFPVLIAALLMVSFATQCAAPPAAPTSAPPSAPTSAPPSTAAPPAASGEPITLTIWWWGETENAGLGNWLNETIGMYEQQHPNIKIQQTLQTADSLYTAFRAAADAKTGPDIQYMWNGTWILEDVWAGRVAPLSDYWTADDFKTVLNANESKYDGKIWGVGWYTVGMVLVYNKSLFTKAGLDPEKFPQTWSEYLAASEKLKGAGITPFAVGVSDGALGEWLMGSFTSQTIGSYDDVINASLGQGSFKDPKFLEPWQRLQEMYDKKYLNDDVSSLAADTGAEPFLTGKAAMTYLPDSLLATLAKAIGPDNLGIMPHFPLFGNGPLADKMQFTAQSLVLASWSPHKQEAADFLKFMHTAERVNAQFKETGALPADTQVDTSLITLEATKKAYQWRLNQGEFQVINYLPQMVDSDGNFTGLQNLWNGTWKASDVVANMDQVAAKWRASSPSGVQNFTTWAKTR